MKLEEIKSLNLGFKSPIYYEVNHNGSNRTRAYFLNLVEKSQEETSHNGLPYVIVAHSTDGHGCMHEQKKISLEDLACISKRTY